MKNLTEGFRGQEQVILIVLVSVAVKCLAGTALGQEVEDIVGYGSESSREDAEALEAHLDENPNDAMARLQLYGFYQRNRRSPQATESQVEHALWLIEHRPKSEVHRTLFAVFSNEKHGAASSRARELWIDHSEQHEEHLGIAEYAGLFLRSSDPDLAKSLFQKGREAEPKEPRWPSYLGGVSLREMAKAPEGSELKKQLAADAFKLFLEAYRLSTESEQNSLLPRLCQTALHSEEFGIAEEYARKMLRQDTAGRFGYLKNHYHGHTVLGVLKFVSGDIDGAKRLLMRSMNAPASRRDMTGQPDFSLLRRFIEHGDSETAIEFLKACESVWKKGRVELREWQETLRKGEPLVFAHPGIY